HVWQEGDIAFLKPDDSFTEEEHRELIQAKPGHKHGYIPARACGHPVIVLHRMSENSTHILITPVSAYSSGEENNYLPPWRQEYHKWKTPDDFRSFFGCERSSERYPYLYLEDGQSMPKPKASWLYIQSVWCVPLTVIGRFTKTRELLRVRNDSLVNLRQQMAEKAKRWRECLADLKARE
ncbi:hypothetical protein B0T22DRAFT_350506, partial [Podospora appendiculata]